MKRSALLIVVVVAAGCGDVVQGDPDATSSDAPIAADGAPGADAMVAANECANPSGTNTVFINTNGGDYSPSGGMGSNPATNQAVAISQAGTLAGWQVAPAVTAEMIDCLREVFAPYDLELVETEPSPPQLYHEMVITSTPSNTVLGAGLQIPSIGELGCIPLTQSIGFSFTNFSDDPLTVCRSAASVFGFSQGLSRVMNVCTDAMTNTFECPGDEPIDFLDDVQTCGRTQAQPCNCDTSTMIQNSHQRLLQTLGPCP